MSHPPVIFCSVLLSIGLLAVLERHPWVMLLLPVAGLALLRRRPRVVAFPEHVAALMRAHGWRNVAISAAMGPLGTDITGTATDGRRWVIRCHHGTAAIEPADVQRFADTVHHMRRAEAHALITAGTITRQVRAAAQGSRTTLLNHAALQAWATHQLTNRR